MQTIQLIKHLSIDVVLGEMEIQIELILNIRKRLYKFPGHLIRKEGLENMILARKFEVNWKRGKQRVTYVMDLCNWRVENGFGEIAKRRKVLSVTRDRMTWSAMITYILK